MFAIPEGVTLEEACLLEPLSVGMRAVALSGATAGQTVAVVGLGAIGQCVVQVLRAQGVTGIIAVDRSTMRLQRALESGASATVDGSNGNLTDELIALTHATVSPFQEASDVDVVIECAGAVGLLPAVLRATKAGGSVVFVGLFSRPVEIDINTVVQKELRLCGSFAYTVADVKNAFELIATGRVDMASLITHRRPLDELGAAFDDQLDGESSIKVVVGPGS
ncbi:zinc-binding dehydrogenase [Aeromicrobium sp.]|uniref:zinc-dependent alcohol dehydrogenase n=1 Tax=Aeromicrobium sp. TaxID=1871063 RepID=UPI0025C5662D|nr:zinc-binding dehydrogenase [Aeromicrobium sp.]